MTNNELEIERCPSNKLAFQPAKEDLHKGKDIVDGVAIYGVFEGVGGDVIYTNGTPATIVPNGVQQ